MTYIISLLVSGVGEPAVHQHRTRRLCLPLKEEVPSLGNGQDGEHEIRYGVGRTLSQQYIEETEGGEAPQTQ